MNERPASHLCRATHEHPTHDDLYVDRRESRRVSVQAGIAKARVDVGDDDARVLCRRRGDEFSICEEEKKFGEWVPEGESRC